ncbi:MAG TPA: putative toxin-antitoxin system toxin component, PIN family [Acidobacteriaceae bacterium]
MSRRVVFDTSTLVSAALRIGSIPHQALLEAFATCDVCSSQGTLDELERVLNGKKFDRYLDRASRSAFVALMRRHAISFDVPEANILTVAPACRDPEDNQFLALADVARANFIVSSDKDLLVLNPWHRIAVLTPAEFLAQVAAKPSSSTSPEFQL